MFKKIAIIFFPLILTVGIFSFFDDDISSQVNPPESFNWGPPLNDKRALSLQKIFGQNFYYLDEGGQSFAFVSEDGKYVLKLFKFNRFTPYWWITILPEWGPLAQYRQEHIDKRQNKLIMALNGHRIAYQELRPESKLLYVQLAPEQPERIVTLIDKKGNHHNIDLGRTVFVLQEKGEMLSTAFSKHLDRGEVDEVAKQIGNLYHLYLSEYKKGIVDLDHGVMHNIGIVGNEPFHLDVGKMTRDESVKQQENARQDMQKVAGKIDQWIEKNYPEYAETLRKRTVPNL